MSAYQLSPTVVVLRDGNVKYLLIYSALEKRWFCGGMCLP